jgi:hypothetical protein
MMMTVADTLERSMSAGVSRRRSIRLRAPSHLRVRIATGRASAAVVLDISEGGLAALTDRPLAIDSPHTLELVLGGEGPLIVRAEVASCQFAEQRGGHSVYRTGFRFRGRPKPGSGTVEDLLDRLLASTITVC